LVRVFRAVYLGLFFNCFIIASVNLAAAKIANVLFGIPEWLTLVIAAAFPVIFASMSGLWGVMVTDTIQFFITISSAFAAAYYAVKLPQVGGLSGLFHHISQSNPHWLSILPNFADWKTAAAIFVIPLTVQWWSVWYLGAEPGGGSYVAQRMLAARPERDSVFGTMFFQAAHYALRPWPWIIVALASMIVYPTLGDIQQRFPYVQSHLLGNDIAYPAMLVFLPAGFAGFMVAGLFAAYRSTLETHLNWGTSYLVHDLYRRFIVRDGDERYYVLVGRIVTVLIMVVAIGITSILTTAHETFNVMLSIGAGTGLVYLLRWFWWRINAWTEVSAMVSSFIVSLYFFVSGKLGHPTDPSTALLWTVAITTVTWVSVTFLTPAVDRETLIAFYKRVLPAGPGWARIRAESGDLRSPDSLPLAFLGWLLGLLAVDVDPLVVAGGIGERVDLLLGHLVPAAGAHLLPHPVGQVGDGDLGGGHVVPPCQLFSSGPISRGRLVNTESGLQTRHHITPAASSTVQTPTVLPAAWISSTSSGSMAP